MMIRYLSILAILVLTGASGLMGTMGCEAFEDDEQLGGETIIIDNSDPSLDGAAPMGDIGPGADGLEATGAVGPAEGGPFVLGDGPTLDPTAPGTGAFGGAAGGGATTGGGAAGGGSTAGGGNGGGGDGGTTGVGGGGGFPAGSKGATAVAAVTAAAKHLPGNGHLYGVIKMADGEEALPHMPPFFGRLIQGGAMDFLDEANFAALDTFAFSLQMNEDTKKALESSKCKASQASGGDGSGAGALLDAVSLPETGERRDRRVLDAGVLGREQGQTEKKEKESEEPEEAALYARGAGLVGSIAPEAKKKAAEATAVGLPVIGATAESGGEAESAEAEAGTPRRPTETTDDVRDVILQRLRKRESDDDRGLSALMRALRRAGFGEDALAILKGNDEVAKRRLLAALYEALGLDAEQLALLLKKAGLGSMSSAMLGSPCFAMAQKGIGIRHIDSVSAVFTFKENPAGADVESYALAAFPGVDEALYTDDAQTTKNTENVYWGGDRLIILDGLSALVMSRPAGTEGVLAIVIRPMNRKLLREIGVTDPDLGLQDRLNSLAQAMSSYVASQGTVSEDILNKFAALQFASGQASIAVIETLPFVRIDMAVNPQDTLMKLFAKHAIDPEQVMGAMDKAVDRFPLPLERREEGPLPFPGTAAYRIEAPDRPLGLPKPSDKAGALVWDVIMDMRAFYAHPMARRVLGGYPTIGYSVRIPHEETESLEIRFQVWGPDGTILSQLQGGMSQAMYKLFQEISSKASKAMNGHGGISGSLQEFLERKKAEDSEDDGRKEKKRMEIYGEGLKERGFRPPTF